MVKNAPAETPTTLHTVPPGSRADFTSMLTRDKSYYEKIVGGWSAMPNQAHRLLACCDELTARDFKVYHYLLSCIEMGGYAEVSQKTIAADVKISAQHVSTIISKLINLGLIIRHKVIKQKYYFNLFFVHRGSHQAKDLNKLRFSPETQDMRARMDVANKDGNGIGEFIQPQDNNKPTRAEKEYSDAEKAHSDGKE